MNRFFESKLNFCPRLLSPLVLAPFALRNRRTRVDLKIRFNARSMDAKKILHRRFMPSKHENETELKLLLFNIIARLTRDPFSRIKEILERGDAFLSFVLFLSRQNSSSSSCVHCNDTFSSIMTKILFSSYLLFNIDITRYKSRKFFHRGKKAKKKKKKERLFLIKNAKGREKESLVEKKKFHSIQIESLARRRSERVRSGAGFRLN